MSDFDDAKSFWEWLQNRDDDQQPDEENPFLSETPEEFLDEVGISPAEFENILERDPDHFGGEYAIGGYTMDQLSDVIAYCMDAPPGILRFWIDDNGEIEIYRYPSGGAE